MHPTWFLILFLFIWWTNDSFTNAIIAPDQGFYAAVIAAFLFFGSIVLHELGHAFAARREGIGVGGIDLFFFGGFMRAMRDSETPGEEFRVAAAGPAVTLLLTIVFGGVGYALLGDMLLHAATFDYASGTLVEVVIAFTALANAGLFVLNMVPAFPLDGGRITRAVAWQLSGDRHKATRFAAYLGQGFAVLMMGYGVYVFLGGRATRAAACGGSSWAGCSAARRAPRSPRAASPTAWTASPPATSWIPSPSPSPPA